MIKKIRRSYVCSRRMALQAARNKGFCCFVDQTESYGVDLECLIGELIACGCRAVFCSHAECRVRISGLSCRCCVVFVLRAMVA
jgi:hypothetical protein